MSPSPADQTASTAPISLDRLMEAASHTVPPGYLPIELGGGPIGRWARRWVPSSLVDGRTPRRRWVFLAVVFSVVVVVLAAYLLVDSPQPELPPTLPVAHEIVAGKTETSKNADKPAESLVISVIGKVAQPGLVTVPAGSRVADALEAAGGVVAGTDASALNLARRLEDGEQLAVGLPVPVEAPASVGAPTVKKIDLNTATVAEFDQLPGVGEVTAQRILQWRSQHGRFTKVEQLREVEGIGESRFSKLRDQVMVR